MSAPARGPFDGPREFTGIKPPGTRLSEYEALSVFVQPVEPGEELPVAKRFAWPEDSTAVRCSDWYAFRDPAQMWQRPYTKRQAEQERAIERATSSQRTSGMLERIQGRWAHEVLGDIYVTAAFFERALFRALSHCSIPALSDVVSMALIFNAVDKERHAEAILFHQYDLAEAGVPLGDDDRRDQWLEGPVFQATRRVAERLNGCADWCEVALVTNLLVEPLLGRLLFNELLWAPAPGHGDCVSPVLLAEAETDRQRNIVWAVALTKLLVTDEEHGRTNRERLEQWLTDWWDDVVAAASGLASLAPVVAVDSAVALATVESAWRHLLNECGLEPECAAPDAVGLSAAIASLSGAGCRP